MKKFNVTQLVKIAAVAAIYFVLTVAISPLAYGPIQFRFAEILVLLCFYNKNYCYSMAIGCAFANYFSPTMLFDVPFGTFATIIAVILISKSKNIIIASLFPVISNGIILAIEFRIAYMANKLKYADFNTPIFINMATIAFGELVVVSILGVIVFKLLEKNKFFMKLIS